MPKRHLFIALAVGWLFVVAGLGLIYFPLAPIATGAVIIAGALLLVDVKDPPK